MINLAVDWHTSTKSMQLASNATCSCWMTKEDFSNEIHFDPSTSVWGKQVQRKSHHWRGSGSMTHAILQDFAKGNLGCFEKDGSSWDFKETGQGFPWAQLRWLEGPSASAQQYSSSSSSFVLSTQWPNRSHERGNWTSPKSSWHKGVVSCQSLFSLRDCRRKLRPTETDRVSTRDYRLTLTESESSTCDQRFFSISTDKKSSWMSKDLWRMKEDDFEIRQKKREVSIRDRTKAHWQPATKPIPFLPSPTVLYPTKPALNGYKSVQIGGYSCGLMTSVVVSPIKPCLRMHFPMVGRWSPMVRRYTQCVCKEERSTPPPPFTSYSLPFPLSILKWMLGQRKHHPRTGPTRNERARWWSNKTT